MQDENGTVINTSSKIAEHFNNYFSTIADKLKSQTKLSDQQSNTIKTYKSNLINPVVNSMYLNPSHPAEINDTINCLKTKTTSKPI